MRTRLVSIPASRISDWETFHEVFAEALGFPDYYGRNMNAWIDCMTFADDSLAQMIRSAVRPGDLLALEIEDVSEFAARCPEQFEAIVECTAFVNYRRTELGQPPVLALLISGYFQ